jgi:Chlorophyll A-B binding protein
MKTFILASLLVSSAYAFAPLSSPTNAASSSLHAAVDSMPGSINFMRKPFVFDPLKLAETYEPLLPWFRESELRHGRTAMLAVPGFIVADLIRLPGDAYSFENIPKTIEAHDKLWAMGIASPMTQLLVFIGLWDLVVTGPAALAAHQGKREPGGTLRWLVWLR